MLLSFRAISHNLFDFSTEQDGGNLISAFGGKPSPGPATFHNNLVSNPGRGVMWFDCPFGKLEIRKNHIIARTTATSREDCLFGFHAESDFGSITLKDNRVECLGTPRPLVRNDESGTAGSREAAQVRLWSRRRTEGRRVADFAKTLRLRTKGKGAPESSQFLIGIVSSYTKPFP